MTAGRIGRNLAETLAAEGYHVYAGARIDKDFAALDAIEDQTFICDVKVEGVYRTTRSFAPLVIESKGRIVTTGSVAAAGPWPGGSAYSGSKQWRSCGSPLPA